MAFANIAGRAGFVLELDKSQVDRGLPQAEQQFDRSTAAMAASADRAGRAIGEGRAGAGLVGRLALIAPVAVAAVQNLRTVSDSLNATGEEAFTTEGRIRNFASSLLSGDLIGGIQALSALPKTFQEIGLSAGQAFGAFSQHLEQLRALAESGGPLASFADSLADMIESTRTAEAAQAALADAVGRVGAAFTTAGGAAVTFRGAVDDAGGLRGPGAVDQINTNLAAQDGTSSGRIARPIGPTARNAAAQTIAQAEGNLNELLRLQVAERDRLQKALENSRGNVKQREQLNQQLAAARAAVINTQQQIEANAKAEAQAARNAREAERREREARAAEDARALRERLAAREQQLRNQYEAALQTPGRADDRRRFDALRGFLAGEARDPRLSSGERADFRGELIALRGQRRKDIEQLRDAELNATREELAAQEQVLQNRVKAAEQTKKNKADDLKALREIRDFYRKHERDRADVFSGLEQARFGSDRLDTQKRIRDLLSGKPDDGPTADDLGALFRDFMRWQTDMLRNGPNVTGGNLGTHVLEQLTREQTSVLKGALTGPPRGAGRALDEAVMAW